MQDEYFALVGGWWAGYGWIVISALRILVILILAWIVIGLSQGAVHRLRERIASRLDDRESIKRAETLGRVFRYLVTVIVSLVAGMLVLAELGVSVAPILGAAGVVGIAVGFGAQSLVKDYFTGFFLLLENQIRTGDVVRVGDHAGFVEEVTLRFVQLRDYDGNVHFVPNGTITSVVNMSRGYAQAVVDVPVGYGADLHVAMKVMIEVAAGMRSDPLHQHRFVGDFEMAGVERLDDSAVIIRARMKVAPLEQWTVKREYLLRLKIAFDEAGIEIPLPQLVINRPAPTGAKPDPLPHVRAVGGESSKGAPGENASVEPSGDHAAEMAARSPGGLPGQAS